MVRPQTEWLIVWGYDIAQAQPLVDAALATQAARQLVGDPALEIALCTQPSCKKTAFSRDAAHRHPPSNGLGSNTSIQDGFNLAWKLAMVVKGQAGPGLLDSYSADRAPIARQIVTRANQSIAKFGPIFEALGRDGGMDMTKSTRTWTRAAIPRTRARRRGRLCARRLPSKAMNSTPTGSR